MSVALHKPRMTRDQFFTWAQAREERYEFDGFQPVAMNGGTLNHSQIAQNLYFALRSRLQGTGCRPLGPDAGVATIDDAVRYPDALVTCTKGAGTDRLVPGVIVVFEVLSPTSGRTDRIIKLREYQAVPSIKRYVILEYASIGLTDFVRADGDHGWAAAPLTAEGTLHMPEIGIEIPVIELYEGVDLPAVGEDTESTGN
jgi:Uma2 family endonuclease